MRDEDIRSLLTDVVTPRPRFENHGGWVMTQCPLARWTHERGADKTPSFGVHVSDDDVSIFHCFTSKKKGPLSHFLRLLGGFNGDDHSDLIASLENAEAYQAVLPTWDSARESRLAAPIRELPDIYKSLYKRITKVSRYLKKRNY